MRPGAAAAESCVDHASHLASAHIVSVEPARGRGKYRVVLEGDVNAVFSAIDTKGTRSMDAWTVYRLGRALGSCAVSPTALREVALGSVGSDDSGPGSVPGIIVAIDDDAWSATDEPNLLIQSHPIADKDIPKAVRLSDQTVIDVLLGRTRPSAKSRRRLLRYDRGPLESLSTFKTNLVVRHLATAERFSARTIDGLLRLDQATLEDFKNADGASLLNAAQVRALLGRRDMIVSWVNALVEEFGYEAVVSFP